MTESLMEYIPTQQQGGARKFKGGVAQGYDAKREDSPKWKIEQTIIEDMLSGFPAGDWVLDAPCGTGRFFKCYAERGFIVRGMDISEDMLMQAAQKVVNRDKMRLGLGDVRGIPMADKSVDVAVMCRLTRWLSPEDCQRALRELQRVTRKRIIFTARVRNHPHARSYELINGALDGWKIARDEAGADVDYRIIALEPV